MYRVTTGEARTDLYGQGKGLAQVIDTSITEDAINAKKKMDFERQQSAEKQKAKREDEIMGNLAAMGKVAVRPNDLEYFAGKQKELYDFVENNVDKLRSGDASAMMQYQRMLGGIQTEAELSKNAREYAEQTIQKYNQNPSGYRKKSLERVLGFVGDPAKAGNWDVSGVQLQENINYMDRVKSVLSPIATSAAQDPSGRMKVFNIDRAKELVANDVQSDPLVFSQIADDLEDATDAELKSLGLSRDTVDPVTYAQAKYAPLLVRKDALAPKESDSDGGSKTSKNIIATTTVTDTKDPKNNWKADIRYEGKNLPYQRLVRKDKDGTEYAQDVIVDKVIKRGGKAYLKVSAKPGQDGTAEVFEIDYDTQDGKELLAGLGIENPMTLFNQGQKDVTPVVKDNVKVQQYSSPKDETKGGKPTLKVGDIKNGYRFKGGDPKNKANWSKV